MSAAKTQCSGRVMGEWRSHQCKHTGKLEHEGAFFCALHHPPTMTAKWQDKLAARNKQWDDRCKKEKDAAAAKAEMARRAELYPDLLAFVQRLIRVGQFFPSCIELDNYSQDGADGNDLQQEAIRLIVKATGSAT